MGDDYLCSQHGYPIPDSLGSGQSCSRRRCFNKTGVVHDFLLTGQLLALNKITPGCSVFWHTRLNGRDRVLTCITPGPWIPGDEFTRLHGKPTKRIELFSLAYQASVMATILGRQVTDSNRHR